MVRKYSLLVGRNGFGTGIVAGAIRRESFREIIEENINDRRGVKRQHLAQQQTADHRDAQRRAALGANAVHPRQRAAAAIESGSDGCSSRTKLPARYTR